MINHLNLCFLILTATLHMIQKGEKQKMKSADESAEIWVFRGIKTTSVFTAAECEQCVITRLDTAAAVFPHRPCAATSPLLPEKKTHQSVEKGTIHSSQNVMHKDRKSSVPKTLNTSEQDQKAATNIKLLQDCFCLCSYHY